MQVCKWDVFGQVGRPDRGEVAHWVLRLPLPTSVLLPVHSVLLQNALRGAEMTSRTRLLQVDMTTTNLVLAEHTQKMKCV